MLCARSLCMRALHNPRALKQKVIKQKQTKKRVAPNAIIMRLRGYPCVALQLSSYKLPSVNRHTERDAETHKLRSKILRSLRVAVGSQEQGAVKRVVRPPIFRTTQLFKLPQRNDSRRYSEQAT